MNIKRLVVGPIQTNCYLLSSGNDIALIDPGDESQRIIEETNKINGTVSSIICTHYHDDHTKDCLACQKVLGGDIIMGTADKEFTSLPVKNFVSEGDTITIGQDKLKVIYTPGHTSGSFCLLGNDFIFTGDTLFLNDYGRTDLPGGSSDDMQKSLNMLKRIIKPGMMVYPGHGDYYQA